MNNEITELEDGDADDYIPLEIMLDLLKEHHPHYVIRVGPNTCVISAASSAAEEKVIFKDEEIYPAALGALLVSYITSRKTSR